MSHKNHAEPAGTAATNFINASAVNSVSCVSIIHPTDVPRFSRSPRHQSSASAADASAASSKPRPPSNTRSHFTPSASAQGKNYSNFARSSTGEPINRNDVSIATTRSPSRSTSNANPRGVP